MEQDRKDEKEGKDGVEGEGSYSGTKDYNERTAKFIKSGKVDKAAKEADPKSEQESTRCKRPSASPSRRPKSRLLLLPQGAP